MDALTKKQRHKNMSHIRAKDTKPERLLHLALWLRGIWYQKNWRKQTGKPDIMLTRYRIVVFVDGDVWHGHEQNPGG